MNLRSLVMRLGPPVTLLAGCQSPTPGTIVGNPGETRLSTADSAGLTYDNAFLSVESVTFTDCQGASAVVPVDGTLDLLDPVILSAPGGTWCGVTATPAGPLWVTGSADAGGSFDLLLDLPPLALSATTGVRIDASAVVFEVGGPDWIDAGSLGLAPDTPVQVQPGDALHDALVAAATTSSALYADDGDGVVTAPERAAGPALGDDDDDDDDDADDASDD